MIEPVHPFQRRKLNRSKRTPRPALAEWLGTWTRSAEAEIRIKQDGAGRLIIAGQATCCALDPDRVKRGTVNLGELDETVAVPKGSMIALGEGYDGMKPPGLDHSECHARLRAFGPYLVVEDNGGCGGNNVSFTGAYMRLK